MVELLDKARDLVPDAWVILLADPAGLTTETHGSWLHSRVFRQRAVTSTLGNVWFSGVPTGRNIVRVKTSSSAAEQRATVVSKQELQLHFTMP